MADDDGVMSDEEAIKAAQGIAKRREYDVVLSFDPEEGHHHVTPLKMKSQIPEHHDKLGIARIKN